MGHILIIFLFHQVLCRRSNKKLPMCFASLLFVTVYCVNTAKAASYKQLHTAEMTISQDLLENALSDRQEIGSSHAMNHKYTKQEKLSILDAFSIFMFDKPAEDIIANEATTPKTTPHRRLNTRRKARHRPVKNIGLDTDSMLTSQSSILLETDLLLQIMRQRKLFGTLEDVKKTMGTQQNG